MTLYISSPTNIIVAQAEQVTFLQYAQWMLFPSIGECRRVCVRVCVDVRGYGGGHVFTCMCAYRCVWMWTCPCCMLCLHVSCCVKPTASCVTDSCLRCIVVLVPCMSSRMYPFLHVVHVPPCSPCLSCVALICPLAPLLPPSSSSSSEWLFHLRHALLVVPFPDQPHIRTTHRR